MELIDIALYVTIWLIVNTAASFWWMAVQCENNRVPSLTFKGKKATASQGTFILIIMSYFFIIFFLVAVITERR